MQGIIKIRLPALSNDLNVAAFLRELKP